MKPSVTICDRIRDLYAKLIKEGNPHDEEIAEIYRAAKRMHVKLFQYKYGGTLVTDNTEFHVEDLKRMKDANKDK